MRINKANSFDKPNNAGGNNPKPPTFKGAPPTKIQKLGDFFTLDKAGPMSRKLFILNAFAFLLGTRIVTSRDKDEIRETIIRDIPTIIIAVLGVPVASKLIAKGMQKHLGVPLVKKTGEVAKNKVVSWFEKSILRKVNPSKTKQTFACASYDELKDWYVFNPKMKSGFKGFTDRLANLDGNLKKIYSSVDDGIKNDLKDFSDTDNKAFIDKLFNGSEESNKVLNKLKTAFANDENKVKRDAMFKCTITKIFGFGSTLGLVGICIPKLNIAITEALHKGENNKKKSNAENKKINA